MLVMVRSSHENVLDFQKGIQLKKSYFERKQQNNYSLTMTLKTVIQPNIRQ